MKVATGILSSIASNNGYSPEEISSSCSQAIEYAVELVNQLDELDYVAMTQSSKPFLESSSNDYGSPIATVKKKNKLGSNIQVGV